MRGGGGVTGGGDLRVWKVGFWSEIVFASQMILGSLFSCMFFLFSFSPTLLLETFFSTDAVHPPSFRKVIKKRGKN